MTSIRKVTRILALGILAAALLVGRAEAATISLSPSSQDATVGDSVSVDILVANLLGESVGGVSLLLSYDNTVLSGLSFTLDPDAKMGFALDPISNDFGSGFGLGGASPFEAFFLADLSLDDTALQGLQGTGFRLARVNFTAIGPGLSPLNFSVQPSQGIFLSDGLGAELPAQATNGSVCVGNAAGAPGNCAAAVPEPGTLVLLGTGVAALVRRRRKAQTKA